MLTEEQYKKEIFSLLTKNREEESFQDDAFAEVMSAYYRSGDFSSVNQCEGNLFHPMDPCCTDHCRTRLQCLSKLVRTIKKSKDSLAVSRCYLVPTIDLNAFYDEYEPDFSQFDAIQRYILLKMPESFSLREGHILTEVYTHLCDVWEGKVFSVDSIRRYFRYIKKMEEISSLEHAMKTEASLLGYCIIRA